MRTNINRITVEAGAGAFLTYFVQDLHELSKRHRCPVVGKFNGREIKVGGY